MSLDNLVRITGNELQKSRSVDGSTRALLSSDSKNLYDQIEENRFAIRPKYRKFAGWNDRETGIERK